MGDWMLWRHCPYCGGEWQNEYLQRQKAKGVIVCGGCGCEWANLESALSEAERARDEALTLRETTVINALQAVGDISRLKQEYFAHHSEYGHDLGIPRPVADYVGALETQLTETTADLARVRESAAQYCVDRCGDFAGPRAKKWCVSCPLKPPTPPESEG